jgi:hypothetical protein
MLRANTGMSKMQVQEQTELLQLLHPSKGTQEKVS